jgi:putative hydrolase of HD superfamily
MAIIHDLVEIYAGDTFIYDEQGKESQRERETIACDKLFGLLPEDQRNHFRDLWNEFEENSTSESKFARSIDRLVPVLLNLQSGGKGWKENKIDYARVFEISSRIANGSSDLWKYVEELLNQNREKGLFHNKTN